MISELVAWRVQFARGGAASEYGYRPAGGGRNLPTLNARVVRVRLDQLHPVSSAALVGFQALRVGDAMHHRVDPADSLNDVHLIPEVGDAQFAVERSAFD